MKITDLIAKKQQKLPQSPLLSYFDNAFSREPSDDFTLAELIGRIRSGAWSAKVEKLRETLKRNRKGYDEAKRALPAVMLSGMLTAGERSGAASEGRIVHSGYLQGDFDGKDHPHLEIDEMRALLLADPHVIAVFASPSGQGIKAVIRIPAGVETHRGAFEAAAEHFAQFGLKIDESTKDPGRLCFVSYDPDAWMRDDVATATVMKAKQRAARGDSGFEPEDTTHDDIREMLEFIPPRPDYEDWLRIASAVWSVLDETTGIALLSEWSPEEKSGEYLRKFKNRLRDVRIGTLAWYAQAHGFDAREAARRKRWAGRIRFADGSTRARTIEVAPDHADGPKRVSDVDGEEIADNPQFVEWCLRHEQRGDAELFQVIAQGARMWDHYAGCWRRWDGSSWERDDLDITKLEFVDSLSRCYTDLQRDLTKQMAAKPADNPKTDMRAVIRKQADERVKSLNRATWLKGSLDLAKSMPKLATRAADFDKAPHLLALENGVLDFDACEFREAHPSDMLTHRAGVKFDPDALCPKFDAFLARMLVEPELIAFVLRAMAYSLTGKVDEDVLFFNYGKGANGKSTFMMIFRLLLGELMVLIDVETLLSRKSDANMDYKKATLQGRRVAMTDEIAEGRKLNESMVKALIGGDDILARNPYEKPYAFSPTHKLWMVGNHKPVIEGTDNGIWRRICLIPWSQTIPKDEQRPRAEVMAELRLELPGILNRLLHAWEEYRTLGGLKPPKIVQDATSEYQTEQDQLGSFLDERTERVLGSNVQAQKLLKVYLAWCEDNGERAIYRTSKQLIARMKDRGVETYRGNNNTSCFKDIEILEAE